jgi:hypothetical protein
MTHRLPPSSPASPTSSTGQKSTTRRLLSRPGPRKQAEDNDASESSSSSLIDPESDESSSDSLAAAERKRFRILNRMMPAAWVRRQLEEHTRKQNARMASRTRPDSPVRPGRARVRTRVRGPDGPLVLVGDSESDKDSTPVHPETEEAPRTSTPPSSLIRTQVRPRVFPAKHAAQISPSVSDNDIIDIPSSDDRSSIVDITVPTVDDDEISSWLVRSSPKQTGRGGGGDLINRMLNRTSAPTRDTKRGSRKVRAGYDHDGRKLKQAKLTSMFRASSQDRVIKVSSSSDGRAEVGVGSSSTRRKTKKARRPEARVARPSGSRRAFTIQGDLAALLDATISPDLGKRPEKTRNSIHNRAVSSNVHIREGQGHSQRPPEATPTAGRQAKLNALNNKTVSTDCGIVPFRPHTKFSPSTYIGRGYLQNLIDIAAKTDTPPVEATPVAAFGEHLDTRLTGTEFVDQVRRLAPHWATWLARRENETGANVTRSYRFIALRVTFLLESPPEEASEASLDFDSGSLAFLEEDAAEIYKVVSALSQTDPAINDATLASDPSWLSFHWFVVELAVRIACGIRRRALRISETTSLVSTDFDTAIQQMIRSLLGHNIGNNIRSAYNRDADLNDEVLEIWICLLYLVDDTEFCGAKTWKPLWTRIESVLDLPEFSLPYKVYESERRWEHIYSFSAIGSFSSQTGRLLPSSPPISRWPWVCKTIKDIRLKEDQVIAGAKQTQQRVDFYVRIVAARCWLLHTMWGWSYSQPDRLLSLLYPVFQTRNLTKLQDERTDFPLFIRDLELEQLDRFSNGDSAWSIFLKIFRQVIINNPTSARKLYSAYSPVAVLKFTNENPATDTDLSRLLNSFAIFLVILITDPTSERGADCVRRMQGLISFKTADMRSREACIRAFQYAGLLFKYYLLELGPLVSWMHIMLESFRDNMQKELLLAPRNRLVVQVLCLVRSVATVTSTCGFDRDSNRLYPEVALLTQGKWNFLLMYVS